MSMAPIVALRHKSIPAHPFQGRFMQQDSLSEQPEAKMFVQPGNNQPWLPGHHLIDYPPLLSPSFAGILYPLPESMKP